LALGGRRPTTGDSLTSAVGDHLLQEGKSPEFRKFRHFHD